MYMGVAEERAFAESFLITDESVDYNTANERSFYVLRERPEGKNERVRLPQLSLSIPVMEIRKGFVDNLDRAPFFLDVEGDYFPDFIEENGIYLVSSAFLDYLKDKFELHSIIYNTVGLSGESGERVEEYSLIIPDEIDCIIPETARYNKQGFLEFFEVDTERIGSLKVFKVRGFPHLIVTEKLNRIQFSGYECTRIENYFDYQGELDRLYNQRNSGLRLQEAVKAYETLADATGDTNYKYSLRRVLEHYKIGDEIRNGIKRVFASHNGTLLDVDISIDRFFMFCWSFSMCRIELVKSHTRFFEEPGFTIDSLAEAQAFVESLPENLIEPAKKVCYETIWNHIAAECRCFDRYSRIHHDLRFRIYLHDVTSKSMIPAVLHDFKPRLQQEMERAGSLSGFDLFAKDLRELDFSGKSLVRVVFSGCDLRRVRFHGCNLNGATFKDCNLMGAEFDQSLLSQARFLDNNLELTSFDRADMKDAEITGSDLWHCSFIQSDLSRAKIKNIDLSKAYFYRTKLMGAIFEVPGTLHETVFRLCDLRNAQFIGDPANDDNMMFDCDLQNSNLTEARFELNMIATTSFTKGKLIAADFSSCGSLSGCNFSWSSCAGMDLGRLAVDDCIFTHVDLSRMKTMTGALFSGNDFSYADLACYDFGICSYGDGNKLIHTNLSYCKLDYTNFTSSKLMKPVFEGAKLNGAIFKAEQLDYAGLTMMQKQGINVISSD